MAETYAMFGGLKHTRVKDKVLGHAEKGNTTRDAMEPDSNSADPVSSNTSPLTR